MSYYNQKSASGEGLVQNAQPYGSVYTNGGLLISTNTGVDNQVLLAHTNAAPTFGNITPGIITGVVTLAQGGTGINNTSVAGFFAGPSGSTGSASFRSIVLGDLPSIPFTNITGTVPVSQGGTNLTTVVPGGVLTAGGAGIITYTTGTSGQVLTSNGSSAPTFQSISGLISGLTTGYPVIAGSATTLSTPNAQLQISQGGTGLSSITNGGVLASDGSGALSSVVGTSGQVLTSNGASAPTFQSISGLISGLTNTYAVFASSATSIYTPTTAVNNFQMVPNGQGFAVQQTAQRCYNFMAAQSTTYSAGSYYSNAADSTVAWFGLEGLGGANVSPGNAFVWSQIAGGQINFYNGVTSTFIGRISTSGITGISDIAITNTKTANTVWAGPTTGSAVPSFRALVVADIPALPFSSLTGF